MWLLVLIIIAFFLMMIITTVEGLSVVLSKILIVLSFCIMFSATLFGIIKTIEVSEQPEMSIVEKSYNIYSLKSDLGVEGAFVLGCGSVESEIYYIVLMKNEIGYYQKTFKGNIYIVETNDHAPRIDYMNYYRVNKYMSLMFNFNTDSTADNYIIYVPIGTIIINYEI